MKELKAPIYGTKQEMWERIGEYTAKRELEVREREWLQKRAEELRGTAQPQLPDTLPVPEPPTEQERKDHELTHLPARPWCIVCQLAKGVVLVRPAEVCAHVQQCWP